MFRYFATLRRVMLGLPVALTEDKVALVKRKLAQRILVSATAGGVRDVETLKKQAMRSLAGGVRGGELTSAPEAA